MPNFQPIPMSELKRNRLMERGVYDFEVRSAENKTFQTGSKGILLKCTVFQPNGGEKWIDCNLVFSEKALFQVADFCAAVGLMANYESGNLDARDCEGRAGKCRVGIEEKEGYEPRNKISGFVVPKPANAAPRSQPQSARVTPAPASTSAPTPSDDSEIPF